MALEEGFAIGYYINFFPRGGGVLVNRCYQYVFPGQTRQWEGLSYQFAPFAFEGDLASAAGSSSQASIAAPFNALVTPVFKEAATLNWLVRVKFVMLASTPPVTPGGRVTWNELTTIAEDIWHCSSYGAKYMEDTSSENGGGDALALGLTSALNAVDAEAPNIVLTSAQVGALPVTGQILLS